MAGSDEVMAQIDRVDGVTYSALVPNAKGAELAIAARYILTPAIFDCLAQTKPGIGGEIQLTDGLRLLLAREPIHGVILKAKRHDIGNPIDWLRTNLIFASQAPEIWKQLGPLLRQLQKAP